jgi:hypothetical protein
MPNVFPDVQLPLLPAQQLLTPTMRQPLLDLWPGGGGGDDSDGGGSEARQEAAGRGSPLTGVPALLTPMLSRERGRAR